MKYLLTFLMFLNISCAGLTPAQKTALGLQFAACSAESISAPVTSWVSDVISSDPNWKYKLGASVSSALGKEIVCAIQLLAASATAPRTADTSNSVGTSEAVTSNAAKFLQEIRTGKLNVVVPFEVPDLTLCTSQSKTLPWISALMHADPTWFVRVQADLRGPFGQDIACTMLALANEPDMGHMKTTYETCKTSMSSCLTIPQRASYFIVDMVSQRKIRYVPLPS